MTTGIELEKAVNADAQKIWSFFYWTEQTYPWEILVRLAEAEFKSVPASVLDSVQLLSESMLTSSAAELAARQVKLRSQANLAGKVSRVERWHALATSEILSDHDRRPMVVTEASKHGAPKDLPAALFEATVHDHSLEDHISTLTEEATWLNISPERREQTFVSFVSFMQLTGDLKQMLNVWQGHLCTAGSLIYRTTDRKRTYLVVHVTPHGVLVRDCILNYDGGDNAIEFDSRSTSGASGFRVLQVTNYNEWKCVKLRLIAPFETHEKRSNGDAPPNNYPEKLNEVIKKANEH